jgi:hypothetical protein
MWLKKNPQLVQSINITKEVLPACVASISVTQGFNKNKYVFTNPKKKLCSKNIHRKKACIAWTTKVNNIQFLT